MVSQSILAFGIVIPTIFNCRVIWSIKKDFYDSHFPSNTTQSAGENLYPVVPEGWSRLTTAYTQNEVNYYMAAAIFASIATVSVRRSNRKS